MTLSLTQSIKPMLDARKLSEETLQKLKHQSHQLRLQGYAWSEVSRTLGLSLSTVLRWAKRYQLGESHFQEPRYVSRGLNDISRAKRSLSQQEEEIVLDVLAHNTPADLKHPELQGNLWTRRRVQQMIRLKVGVFLPTRTVSHYLMRWGISSQRPVIETHPVEHTGFRHWLREDYPEIDASIQASSAVAYWFKIDTMAPQSLAFETPSDTPKTHKTWPRQFFSAIDSRGVLHFRLCDDFSEENYTAYQFIKDLEADIQKPVCVMCSALYQMLFQIDARAEHDKVHVISIPSLNSTICQRDLSASGKITALDNSSLYPQALNS